MHLSFILYEVHYEICYSAPVSAKEATATTMVRSVAESHLRVEVAQTVAQRKRGGSSRTVEANLGGALNKRLNAGLPLTVVVNREAVQRQAVTVLEVEVSLVEVLKKERSVALHQTVIVNLEAASKRLRSVELSLRILTVSIKKLLLT